VTPAPRLTTSFWAESEEPAVRTVGCLMLVVE
jgi:hypothetical protein